MFNSSYVAVKLNFLIIILFFISFNNYADSLSRVYELAVKNDYKYKRAISNYYADAELLKISKSDLLPKINADYSLRYLDGSSIIRQLALDVNADLYESDVAISSTTTNNGWTVRLEQAIFDAPAWYEYQAGKTEKLIVDISLEQAKQDLILRVVNAYIDILRVQDNLAATRSEENAFMAKLKQTQGRFDLGMIAVSEVIELQSVYDLAKIRTLNEVSNVESTTELLSIMTGMNHSSLNLLRSDFVVTSPEPLLMQEWIDAAESDNLEILLARQKEIASNQKRKSASWEHSPTLKLQAFISRMNTNGTTSSSIESPFILAPDQSIDSIGIGLSLQVPIYNGGTTSANKRRAAYQYEANKHFVGETRRNVATKLRQSFLQVKSNINKIKGRTVSINSAKAALKTALAGYDNGSRNIMNVLNAQNVLYSAERDYASSRYDYIQSYFSLRAIGGSLNSGDIHKLDAFLIPPSYQELLQRTSSN